MKLENKIEKTIPEDAVMVDVLARSTYFKLIDVEQLSNLILKSDFIVKYSCFRTT